MEALALVLVWLAAIGSGGLLSIGIIEIMTGQAVIRFSRRTWSVSENRLSGLCTTIQGSVVAIYTLISGLLFGTHTIEMFWVGHWWGLFATAPFVMTFIFTLSVQAYLQIRHDKRRQTIRV
jgi:hypothetical protein